MKLLRPSLKIPTIYLILLTASNPFTSWCRKAPSQIKWTHTLSEAKALAQPENKLTIVDIYTDWCSWCKRMDVETWPHPSVLRESDKYVFLKLNAENDPDGIAVQREFGITSYPTVLLLDSNGDEFERLQGYMPGKQFLKRLNAALTDPESLGNLRKRANREPTNLSLRLELGKKLFNRYSFEDAQSLFEDIVKQDPENTSQVADSAMFFVAMCQATVGDPKDSLATLERLQKMYPGSKVSPNAEILASKVLILLGRKTEAKARIEEFLKTYPEHTLVRQARKLRAEIS